MSFWRSKSLHSVLLAGLILLAFEAGVRVRAFIRHGNASTEADIYDRDGRVGQVPRAGATMMNGEARTSINRWGFRGRDVGLGKPAGTVRILCLGASTTFGQPGDDDRSVWPARLEELLNRVSSEVRYEVLNGAIPGCTVERTLANYAHRLARFDPDVVVVYQAATDVAAHARRQFGDTSGGFGGWSLAALRDRWSLAYMLMRANTSSFMAGQFPATRHDRLDERGVKEFAERVSALVRSARADGCAVLLCTFPRAFDAGQPDSVRRRLARSALFFNPQLSLQALIDIYDRYNAAIRRIAAASSVPVADLDRALPRDERYFIDSIHLSGAGHRMVAESVAGVLRERRVASRGGTRSTSPDAVQ